MKYYSSQGPLNLDDNNWGGAAVEVWDKVGLTFESIKQTGAAVALQLYRTTDITVKYLEAVDGVRRYGGYGVDNTNLWIQLSNVVVRSSRPTTGAPIRLGEHGHRHYGFSNMHYGHPTLRLPVPADHPAHGWSTFVLHLDDFDGEAFKLMNGDGFLAEWVKCGHDGVGGQIKVGPLGGWIDDLSKPREGAASKRVSFENFELHVGKRFLQLESGVEKAKFKNGLVWAKGGACLNLLHERVSKDKLVKWAPASVEYFDNVTFRGQKLWSDESVRNGAPSRCVFAPSCRFHDEVTDVTWKLGDHGEFKEKVTPTAADPLDRAKDLNGSGHTGDAVSILIEEVRKLRK